MVVAGSIVTIIEVHVETKYVAHLQGLQPFLSTLETLNETLVCVCNGHNSVSLIGLKVLQANNIKNCCFLNNV